MSQIGRVLLGLYNLIPEWLLGIALLLAGSSFALSAWWHRRGVSYYLWPFEIGVSSGFILIGIAYLWLALVPELSLDLWRGAVRLLILILTAMIVLYNGGAIHVSWTYIRRKWRKR